MQLFRYLQLLEDATEEDALILCKEAGIVPVPSTFGEMMYALKQQFKPEGESLQYVASASAPRVASSAATNTIADAHLTCMHEIRTHLLHMCIVKCTFSTHRLVVGFTGMHCRMAAPADTLV